MKKFVWRSRYESTATLPRPSRPYCDCAATIASAVRSHGDLSQDAVESRDLRDYFEQAENNRRRSATSRVLRVLTASFRDSSTTPPRPLRVRGDLSRSAVAVRTPVRCDATVITCNFSVYIINLLTAGLKQHVN